MSARARRPSSFRSRTRLRRPVLRARRSCRPRAHRASCPGRPVRRSAPSACRSSPRPSPTRGSLRASPALVPVPEEVEPELASFVSCVGVAALARCRAHRRSGCRFPARCGARRRRARRRGLGWCGAHGRRGGGRCGGGGWRSLRRARSCDVHARDRPGDAAAHRGCRRPPALGLPEPGVAEPELCPVEVSPSVSSSLARLASADCSVALACSRVTSALCGSSVGRAAGPARPAAPG